MYKIHCLNKISQSGLNYLNEAYNLEGNLEEADAILVRSAKMHDMNLGSNLKAIARAGAGVNNIPVAECAQKGIVVFNTPGANANAVKELVIAGLLLSSRKVFEGITWAKTLNENVAKEVEKGKSAFAGPEIANKKLGIIGLGAIGVLVANSAQALGMEVIGYDPYLSIDSAWGLSRHTKQAKSIDEILMACDYISLHVPLVDETRAMLNAEAFEKVKPGVRLLNFSRAGLVDSNALKEAIAKGIVSKYVTDFPVEDVLNVENIICIPHLGASTPESEENCAVMAAKQIKAYLEHGNIVNSVNFPECAMPWNATHRLTIIHKNKPAMIGRITQIIADECINISDMLNKSKGEWAYTIIDTDTLVTKENVKNIEALDDIVKVRSLIK